MLRMFLGKPGGGKSSGALRDIVEELAFGHRVVVTNLSLDAGKLNAFLQRRYPEADVDLFKRLRILNETEARRFWLYRSPTVVVPDVTKEQEKAGVFPDFGNYAGDGVLFVIDEAHIMFDARAWQESGQSLTYYNSQHRKLNDELIFVTQFLELIDKRVRGFAQEFWYFRNNGVEKFMTFFVLPAYFTVKVYQRPPTGLYDLPSETHRYRLDIEMANCYDTSAGVGIKGRAKPETKPKKGFAIWWLAVPAAAALYLFWAAPEWAAQAVAKSGRKTELERSARDSLPGQPAEGPVVPSAQSRAPVSVSHFAAAKAHPTGYLVKGGKVIVQMSDGTHYTERDPELQRVEKNSVTIAGEKMMLRARAEPSAPGAGARQDGSRGITPAAPASSTSTASGRDEGAWARGSDGVARLKEPATLFLTPARGR